MNRAAVLVLAILLVLAGYAQRDIMAQAPIRIGVVARSDAFSAALQSGFERLAQAGSIVYAWNDSGDSPASVLDNWLAEGDFDAFVVAATSPDVVIPALENARSEGVPVISVGSVQLPTDLTAAHIGSNPYSVGEYVAQNMVASLPLGAKVAVIADADDPEGTERTRGLIAAASGSLMLVTGTEVACNQESASELLSCILESFDSVDESERVRAVFFASDATAARVRPEILRTPQGDAFRALQVYTVDVTGNVRSEIESGRIDGALVEYGDEIANLSVETLRRILEDRPTATRLQSPFRWLTPDTREPQVALTRTAYRIGGLLAYDSAGTWQALENGYRRASDELGVVVIWDKPTDLESARGQVDLLARWQAQENSFDAYCVTPQTASTLETEIAQVQRESKPVILVGIREYSSFNANAVISVDDAQVGTLIAVDVAEQLPDGGRILLVEGDAGSDAWVVRSAALRQSLGAAFTIEVLSVSSISGSTRERAAQLISDQLTSGTPIAAVVAATNEIALGAADALQGNSVLLYSADTSVLFSTEIDNAIEQGSLTARISVALDEAAYLCVETIIKWLDGRPILLHQDVPLTLKKR
jgi:ABC-type sugar transport system substrate-binding protein